MEATVVGIDVSKDRLDVAIYPSDEPGFAVASAASAAFRASAMPIAGQVPSFGRVCFPSAVRVRTLHVAAPVGVMRRTRPMTRVSRSSTRPEAGGRRLRNQASFRSRRIGRS
jgi:hypothetical protein